MRIDLFLPSSGLAGCVYAAMDTLGAMHDLHVLKAAAATPFPLSWRLLTEPPQDGELAESDSPSALFVPPLRMISLPLMAKDIADMQPLVAHIQARAARGDWLVALGTGVWLLARAGVLDAQAVPVQWLYQSGFSMRYPEVLVDGRQPISISQRIVCGAAPSLVYETMLAFLGAIGFADLAAAVRDKLVYNPARQELAFPLPSDQVSGITRDSPLYKAMQWLRAHADDCNIADAADHAAVTQRTLNRLFQRHLKLSPQDYLTQIRIERARMWLEVTLRSVEDIAHDCGYTDVSAFRRTFRRVTGLAPAEYRKRFAVRSDRARWRLDEVPDQGQDKVP